MKKIPQAKAKKETRITPKNIEIENKHEKVLFSFEAVEKNEYCLYRYKTIKKGSHHFLKRCS